MSGFLDSRAVNNAVRFVRAAAAAKLRKHRAQSRRYVLAALPNGGVALRFRNLNRRHAAAFKKVIGGDNV